MIFMNFLSRSSRATGPKIRVPFGFCSASMMTQAMQGKTVAEAKELIDLFLSMMKGEEANYKPLGELQSLQGVSKLPVRIKCATLAWHAAEEGMADAGHS